MTKPANFPERKRQRQLRALERLSKRMDRIRRRDGNEDFARMEAESLTLLRRTETIKRHVHTKKDRSARGRFQRASA